MTGDAHETPTWLGDDAGTAEVPVVPEPIQPVYAEPASHSAPDDDHWLLGAGAAARRRPARPARHATGATSVDPTDAGFGALGVVAVTGRRPTRPPTSPRPGNRRGRHSVVAGLVALVTLALVSAFLAWVTAEPLWLAAGHARPGTVAVTACLDDGPEQRCTGTFTSADGGFTRVAVPVMGDVPAPGADAPATMTSAGGTRAYVDVDAPSRAAVGLVLILLCGLGIARATGARRLATPAARRTATLLSLTGPLGLLVAMMATTY